jgi:hypothetical protein
MFVSALQYLSSLDYDSQLYPLFSLPANSQEGMKSETVRLAPGTGGLDVAMEGSGAQIAGHYLPSIG